VKRVLLAFLLPVDTESSKLLLNRFGWNAEHERIKKEVQNNLRRSQKQRLKPLENDSSKGFLMSKKLIRIHY